jgi:hypothetical protein
VISVGTAAHRTARQHTDVYTHQGTMMATYQLCIVMLLCTHALVETTWRKSSPFQDFRMQNSRRVPHYVTSFADNALLLSLPRNTSITQMSSQLLQRLKDIFMMSHH